MALRFKQPLPPSQLLPRAAVASLAQPPPFAVLLPPAGATWAFLQGELSCDSESSSGWETDEEAWAEEGDETPPPSEPPSEPSADGEALCRWCFVEAAADDPLLTPCACTGTQRFVHASCLRAWQRQTQLDGRGDKARHCAVCTAPFEAPPVRLSLPEALAVRAFQALHLSLNLWVSATFCSAALGSLSGAAAFVVGANRLLSSTLHTPLEGSLMLAAAAPLLLGPVARTACCACAAACGACVFLGFVFGGLLGLVSVPLLTYRSALVGKELVRALSAALAQRW